MRAKLLLEAFNIRTENNFKYADFDVESLYKFTPETMGTITFEEVEEVKKLIGLTGEETEEELRAIRNTIVRYWSDRLEYDRAQAEHDWEVEKASNPDANISEFRKNCTYDIRQDQMSAFTHVIDMLLHNLKEDVNEDLKGYETVAKIIKNDDGYNVAEGNEPMLIKNEPSLKELLLQLAKYL